MEQKIKVGIIGCGSIAGAHAGGWKACDAEIVAVYDTNAERAKSFAEQFGGEVKSDLASLLDCGVDVVSITTPPVAHADCAVEALKRNINVLLEKPFALNMDDAQRIMDALKSTSAKLMTAFRHRFLPPNQKIKAMIDSGEMGDIVYFFNRFYGSNPAFASDWHSNPPVSGGGAAMDVATHSVDLFRFFFGEVTDKIIAQYEKEIEASAENAVESDEVLSDEEVPDLEIDEAIEDDEDAKEDGSDAPEAQG